MDIGDVHGRWEWLICNFLMKKVRLRVMSRMGAGAAGTTGPEENRRGHHPDMDSDSFRGGFDFLICRLENGKADLCSVQCF